MSTIQPAPLGQEKTITLSGGRTALVRAGKGKDARQAMLRSGGKQEAYLSELMASLVTINEAPVFVEDLDNLPLSDYHRIQEAFGELNFFSV